MPAGNLRNGKTGSYNSQRLENYRGQNRRFMRVFHQKKGGMVSQGFRGLLKAPQGKSLRAWIRRGRHEAGLAELR